MFRHHLGYSLKLVKQGTPLDFFRTMKPFWMDFLAKVDCLKKLLEKYDLRSSLDSLQNQPAALKSKNTYIQTWLVSRSVAKKSSSIPSRSISISGGAELARELEVEMPSA